MMGEEEFKELVRLSGSKDKEVAINAQKKLAELFEEPLRRVVLPQDTIKDIKNAVVRKLGEYNEKT